MARKSRRRLQRTMRIELVLMRRAAVFQLVQRRVAEGPAAAGVIHSDFEHGFIRAETIAYDDYIAFNGEQGAKEAGKFRLEGKEYIVQDGDVLHFRFKA